MSTPVVSEGHVIGYHNGDEYFHEDLMLDLANFAVNIDFIRNVSFALKLRMKNDGRLKQHAVDYIISRKCLLKICGSLLLTGCSPQAL